MIDIMHSEALSDIVWYQIIWDIYKHNLPCSYHWHQHCYARIDRKNPMGRYILVIRCRQQTGSYSRFHYHQLCESHHNLSIHISTKWYSLVPQLFKGWIVLYNGSISILIRCIVIYLLNSGIQAWTTRAKTPYSTYPIKKKKFKY